METLKKGGLPTVVLVAALGSVAGENYSSHTHIHREKEDDPRQLAGGQWQNCAILLQMPDH